VFIVALSFGDSQWLIFPPPGWTLQWYRVLLTDPGWLDSLLTSVELAVIVMVLAVVMGLFASLALVRGKFRGRELVKGVFPHADGAARGRAGRRVVWFFLRIGLTGRWSDL
jgi:putative spermidine/putrescine transport system permease protein